MRPEGIEWGRFATNRIILEARRHSLSGEGAIVG